MSPRRFTEAELVERPALELLDELGWTVVDAYAETLGPAGTLGRDSIHDVILAHRLRDALLVLNPGLPAWGERGRCGVRDIHLWRPAL